MTISIDNKYVRLISGRLRNFKQKTDNLYNFSCPICGDSKKNLTKARGYVFAKGNDLFYRCHNCGASTNIAGLLKHVDAQLHSEYIFECYKSGQANNSIVTKEVLQLSQPKFGKVNKKKIFEHSEWISNLPEGHFCLEYVKRRKIPKKSYDSLLFTDKYKRFVLSILPECDKHLIDDSRLIIPFYNEYDELIAISGRALETSDKTLRYVTIRTNKSQNKLIYGMDRVDLSKKVYVCEGPIDSLFIDNCVASGDANLAMTAKELIKMGVDNNNIVLLPDREPRNKEIVKMIQSAIQMKYNVVIWPEKVMGKDINEMILSGNTPEEIENIIKQNTFNGIVAQLKFTEWRKC
jgi:transcription elongation factor Elf1